MNKVDELILMLNNDISLIEYKKFENIINNDEYYINLINKIKQAQKKYLNNKTIENKEELEKLNDLFYNDINISRYLEYIDDLNNKIQTVINIINDSIKQ